MVEHVGFELPTVGPVRELDEVIIQVFEGEPMVRPEDHTLHVPNEGVNPQKRLDGLHLRELRPRWWQGEKL